MRIRLTPDFFRKALLTLTALAAAVVLALAVLVAVAVQGLPDYEQLADYRPPVTSRVHAGDGSLIAEFANEQRVFVPTQEIPDHVKQAFISAEDKSFYDHSGLDYYGLFRATLRNVGSIFTGDRMQGASTITQQVAKNMLLTSDRTLMRKIKEAFLAQRIEKAFDKEQILELYLNEIFLGNKAYGVGAAALNYFDKPLSQLTIDEAAYLAALPKAPNNYQPSRHMERAIARRNWVLSRMAVNEYITPEQADAASQLPLTTTDRLSGDIYTASSHFVEQVRREVTNEFGEMALKEGGLSIRSSLDPRLQLAASKALRKGLEQYDRRHGWRGPVKRIDSADAAALEDVPAPPPLSEWDRAVVTSASGSKVILTLEDGQERQLSVEDAQWAATGAKREKDYALTPGAAIYVMCPKSGRCALKQKPQVEGALVAMDPHTGRVFALIGGYDFKLGDFSRVTDANRQPGSAFKPIVYAAALDPCALEGQTGCGLTPATLIDDAPFAIAAGDGTVWAPDNYTNDYYGPTTMREGLEKSRNTMTARLVYEMKPERVFEYATRLGIYDPAKTNLAVFSLGLGVGETTPLKMTTAYAMFVNGGRRVTPSFIDRIQDRDGKTVQRTDTRPCESCNADWNGQTPPAVPDVREQVLDPISAYQVVSMAQGVVDRGTAAVVKTVGKTVGGKTGTTNDYKDAWFIGFSPDLVVGVWVGFDQPKSLGDGESGGRLAAPIFRDFMTEALKNQLDMPFRIPAGVRLVRVDTKTGQLPTAMSEATIIEAFRPGTEPQLYADAGTSSLIIGRGEFGFPGLAPPADAVAAAPGECAPGARCFDPNAPPQTPPQADDDLGQL